MKFYLLVFFFCANLINSQNTDSLKLLLKNAKNDTTRCYILNLLIEEESDITVWPKYNLELKSLTETKLKTGHLTDLENKTYLKYLATALNNIGVEFNLKNDAPNALKYYKEALGYYLKSGNNEGLATAYNNIAYIYHGNGDIKNAIDWHTKSLKIREETHDLKGIAYSLNNLGYLYKDQGDLETGLDYFRKCLKIRQQIGDKLGIAGSLNNIGAIYFTKKDYNTAIIYIERSLQLRETISDKEGLGNSWHILGSIYFDNNNLETALRCYEKGLEFRKQINDKSGMASSYGGIGNVFLRLNKYKKANEYYKLSMQLSKEIGLPENLRVSAKHLAQISKLNGDYKSALENYELYIMMRDSLNNIETQKASIKQQTEYDYQQKKALADAENKAKLQLQEENARSEKNKQNIIITAVSIVLLLVAVFSLFLYNRFKVTQKQKAIIELKEKETQVQKEIIEEKHKEITDSINYAERIQRSFLATKDLLDANLQDYFVLFKPKDVVSGDFYWASPLLNGNFAFAIADSTGHGVPGAIMSLLNITSLEKAIETTSNPAEILNLTRQTIINRLKKDGSIEGGKDGMDCSVISINRTKTKLEIAAANNPVWIIRNNELIEIRPDKMPVGKHDKDTEAFTLHTIDLQNGDVIYALTDGFPDQFGGPKGKKFMSKNLKALLLANAHLPLNKQQTILEKEFANWLGSLDQVDDVTLVGIKI